MKKIFKACVAGDSNKVKGLYESGYSVNVTGCLEFSDNVTMLMAAFHENHEEIIDLLLNIDSLDFEVKDSNNWNTLHYAVNNKLTTESTIYQIAKNLEQPCGLLTYIFIEVGYWI